MILEAEFSWGKNNEYTDYLDSRFKGGGYHIITRKDTIYGAGINWGYIFKEHWNPFLGFNTIRKVQLGFRFWI